MKKLLTDKRGGMYIFMLLFLLFVVFAMIIGTEVARVYDIKQNLDDDIYRSANRAIKTAMYEEWRIDGVSKFNESTARSYFYQYLKEDLGLTSSLKKIENGLEVYQLVIDDLIVDGENARMTVKATAYADPLYLAKIYGQKWVIPIERKSRNIRSDFY